VEQWPLSSAKVKNEWSHSSSPLHMPSQRATVRHAVHHPASLSSALHNVTYTFYVWVSVHHKLIYIKEPTWCSPAVCLLVIAILLYMFRMLFASILRSTRNYSSSLWCVTWVLYTLWLSVEAIDPWRLVGYLTPSHVTHQRLLL